MTAGALATGISYLNEEEKLALSLRVGTYQNETTQPIDGLCSVSSMLPPGRRGSHRAANHEEHPR